MKKFNSEIQVWVGDLAEYNNGRLVGDWFMLPMDLEEIYEQVLEEGNEEIYIGDLDSEHYSIIKNMGLRELNEFAEKLESLQEYEQKALIGLMEYYNDLDECLEILENGDFMVYHDCQNMSDVAYQWYEETGQLKELEKHINSFYIDWEALGRDMDIEGTFIQIDNDTIIQIFQ
jgi:antirestriction protein